MNLRPRMQWTTDLANPRVRDRESERERERERERKRGREGGKKGRDREGGRGGGEGGRSVCVCNVWQRYETMMITIMGDVEQVAHQ